MAPEIEIFNNHPQLQVEADPAVALVKSLLIDEALTAAYIHIIFVDDAFLQNLHQEFLSDDSPTDVITFELGSENLTEGEIYISLDRAADHAREFQVETSAEIARLIIHGILHLNGYDDQTAEEQQQMRAKEEFYLKQYPAQIVLKN